MILSLCVYHIMALGWDHGSSPVFRDGESRPVILGKNSVVHLPPASNVKAHAKITDNFRRHSYRIQNVRQTPTRHAAKFPGTLRPNIISIRPQGGGVYRYKEAKPRRTAVNNVIQGIQLLPEVAGTGIISIAPQIPQQRRPIGYRTVIEQRMVPVVSLKKVPRVVMKQVIEKVPVVKYVPKIVDLGSGGSGKMG